jgi:two-component system, cell cycle response regulator DivK
MSSAAARRRSAPPDRQRTGKHRILKDEDAPAPLILIVDDVADTRELYAEYFQHSGLRVALAVDGDHGLWKVTLVKPALVVMDLSMPVMDGWEAIRQMKAHKKKKSIPVIALTGHLSPENLARATAAGADAVLTKPCTPDELLTVVRRLLKLPA